MQLRLGQGSGMQGYPAIKKASPSASSDPITHLRLRHGPTLECLHRSGSEKGQDACTVYKGLGHAKIRKDSRQPCLLLNKKTLEERGPSKCNLRQGADARKGQSLLGQQNADSRTSPIIGQPPARNLEKRLHGTSHKHHVVLVENPNVEGSVERPCTNPMREGRQHSGAQDGTALIMRSSTVRHGLRNTRALSG